MMDHFHEEVVVKRNRVFESILYALANIMMVVTGILALYWMNVVTGGGFSWAALIIFLVMAGCCAGLFFYRDRLRAEYEYTFTNGDLDFAIVYNNKKRKSLGTMRVKNVDAFGPVNSEGFRKIINMPELKRRNWFLNRDANLHYFYYQKENSRNIIVLEPSEELVGMIRKYLSVGAYRP
ncbi:MAG: hypothetical protein E7331_01080 [Clostridiales bacterium]|nr:hypothetical protein [Clostridiales bacterium]